ncbi:MAG: helix-turn-helix domain-containing protein [Chthonomonadaceae bacterium]|nr:helix-turn-helix domain-containing protein [Chthonomonadaceae bacterium]
MDIGAREEFGKYIKKLREDARFSLREAEQLLGISNSYLYQIERGERNPPKIEVLKRMATAYKVSLVALLIAAQIQEPADQDLFFNDDELERAFEYVKNDKTYQFGTHMNGQTLTPEAKRFIVEVYERFTGLKLRGGKKGQTDDTKPTE